jgi:hypothetical protein
LTWIRGAVDDAEGEALEGEDIQRELALLTFEEA